MTTDLILGTAGHIDHGKTALIRALTGIDTDRLPEEKQRGITIELGFAQLELGSFRLGIVDVPGHERFVRNMLAGATGMDLAMLVVAADDSVKPQTHEHLDILRLLDLPAGVIAVTKCDLVDEQWLELVEEEIREVVADTFLAEAPLVRTSAVRGSGLETLRNELQRAAERAAATAPAPQGPFRMAIDRCFTIAGHGTVVTGSVGSGRVHVGDELVIEPGSIPVRVRSLENHDRTRDELHRGQRAAINLAGVHHEQLRRGHELATAGFLKPSRRLLARLHVLAGCPRPLKHRARLRVHAGTAEVLARVFLLDRRNLEPGTNGMAQLHLEEPIVTTWNQPLVLRAESPVITIGGGRVLAPHARLVRKATEEEMAQVEQLESPDMVHRAEAALDLADTFDDRPLTLVRLTGAGDGQLLYQQLEQAGVVRQIDATGGRSVRVHRRELQRVKKRLLGLLDALHDQHPLRMQFDASHVVSRLKHNEPAVVQHVLNQLESDGVLRRTRTGVGLCRRGPQLSQGERKLLEELVQRLRTAGVESPWVEECQKQAARHRDAVGQLFEVAAAGGQLVRITSDYYLHHEVEQQLRRRLADALHGSSGMTLSQIRELLGTSRKYAVPLCEYWDSIGFTVRRGDVRQLGQTEPADRR